MLPAYVGLWCVAALLVLGALAVAVGRSPYGSGMIYAASSAASLVALGNALLHRCELDPGLRELAILRVGRLSRTAYEVFQHERIAREVGVAEEKIAALRDATIEAAAFTDNEKAVLRYTDDVVRNVRASDKTLKAVQGLLTPGALVELTLTIGYYMMVCLFLESTGVDGEDGQGEWLKTAKL